MENRLLVLGGKVLTLQNMLNDKLKHRADAMNSYLSDDEINYISKTIG